MKIENIMGALLLVFVVAVFGIFIWGAIDSHNTHEAACINDARALGLGGRYSNGECQFKTSSGVWLSQLDYLMVYATFKCP